jgi:hypothetical protein
MSSGYEAPSITELGSVHELTQKFNKIGPSSDLFSRITPLVGSIVAVR